MNSTIRHTLATSVLIGGLLATSSSAQAITGGQPDGQDHPQVGAVYIAGGVGTQRCSATLVAPTVVLTAAHCVQDSVGAAVVSFQEVIAESTADMSAVPFPADPAAGYQPSDTAAHPGWYLGETYAHPGYSGFADTGNWNDVGVIVLEDPVTSIEPATLAPEGYLDTVSARQLNSSLFTVVGYGAEVRQPTTGPRRPVTEDFPILRRHAEVRGQRVTSQILSLNGNPEDAHGTGGPCTGDSGGPAFTDDEHSYLVAVTSYSNTALCRSLTGYQRVDTGGVLTWLADFGVPTQPRGT